MQICVVGTGYVGLVAAACLAEMGNDVICVDNDQNKIETLRQGEIPIYEPGLEELVSGNASEGRLRFTTDLEGAVRSSLLCFIAVGTPQGDTGEADLSAVFSVAGSIAEAMDGYRLIVIKSTVPVGTANRVRALVASRTRHEFSVVSNPEFLKQGDAVNDFLKPARVVVGCDDARSQAIMNELYSPFLRTGNPVITMDVLSSEMTKYVANALLATKISFINEMSQLCERTGADINQVRFGVCSDPRIGNQFLFPGLGFGGSCFPKDLQALLWTGQESGMELPIVEAVARTNQRQRANYIARVKKHYGDVKGLTFAIWGLSFKPRTDDIREAPSVTVIESLLAAGAKLRIYDPKATSRILQRFPEAAGLHACTNAYEALEGADGLLLLTEWNEFRRPNFDRMKASLRQAVIFDGRNLYEPDRMRSRGFTYYAIGRPMTLPNADILPKPALVANPGCEA